MVIFSADTIQGCEPLNVNFNDNSTPIITNWLWNFGDVSSAQNNFSAIQNPTHQFINPGTYSISLTVTSSDGCVNSKTNQNMIQVYPNPVAQFTFDPQQATITNPEIQFQDHSTYSSYWSWNFGDSISINDNTSSIQNPYHDYTNPGTYDITLIVTTSHGCMDSVTHHVIISPEFTFYAPNAFTPDGDGLNDYFFPKGEGWDFNNYQLFIYDRWGEQIFSTNDPKKYWDGRANGGSEIAQEGVYVWVVTVKDIYGKPHSFNGRVTLVRY